MIRVLEAAASFSLDDRQLFVAGDWHGNVPAIQRALPAAHRMWPQVSTLLHVGDFWTDSRSVDYWSHRTGIQRVFVTLGNHEPYDAYRRALDLAPRQAVRISEVVWLLPRPFRFEAGGRSFLSLGGASSIDRALRTPEVDWFEDERITDEQVEEASQARVDLMITHETPEDTPVPAVRHALAAAAAGISVDASVESARSRSQIQAVWDAARPQLLIHGHMHLRGRGCTPDGRRVVSLPRDGEAGNIALLDLEKLDVFDSA